MKKVLCATVAVAALGIAGAAQAEELWSPHLPGVDIGLAAGALPPKGVYFINNDYVSPNFKVRPNSANSLSALVDVPILLWAPGIKFLGADYAAAVAQPFDYTTLGGASSSTQGHLGTYNTVLVPVMLSWALPYDFHVKPQFAVYLNDASSTENRGALASNGNVGAGMANTTFEPGLGLSWLHNGWNASVSMGYDHSTADGNSALNPSAAGGACATNMTCNYQSGDQFFADYTLTKEVGKWTLGVGGYQLNQLNRDQVNGVSQVGTMSLREAVGPVIGYQFGGINIQSQFTHEFVQHNDVGGDVLNVRFVVPLY